MDLALLQTVLIVYGAGVVAAFSLTDFVWFHCTEEYLPLRFNAVCALVWPVVLVVTVYSVLVRIVKRF
jgi:hypothetical protein